MNEICTIVFAVHFFQQLLISMRFFNKIRYIFQIMNK